MMPILAGLAWMTILLGSMLASVVLGICAYRSARRLDWAYAPLMRIAPAIVPLGFVTWWLWRTRWSHYAAEEAQAKQ